MRKGELRVMNHRCNPFWMATSLWLNVIEWLTDLTGQLLWFWKQLLCRTIIYVIVIQQFRRSTCVEGSVLLLPTVIPTLTCKHCIINSFQLVLLWLNASTRVTKLPHFPDDNKMNLDSSSYTDANSRLFVSLHWVTCNPVLHTFHFIFEVSTP